MVSPGLYGHGTSINSPGLRSNAVISFLCSSRRGTCANKKENKFSYAEIVKINPPTTLTALTTLTAPLPRAPAPFPSTPLLSPCLPSPLLFPPSFGTTKGCRKERRAKQSHGAKTTVEGKRGEFVLPWPFWRSRPGWALSWPPLVFLGSVFECLLLILHCFKRAPRPFMCSAALKRFYPRKWPRREFGRVVTGCVADKATCNISIGTRLLSWRFWMHVKMKNVKYK